MATDSIAGLFMSPEMYQQQRDQAALSSFAQQAQMDPLQRASMGAMYGGYQLGNVLAGAMGGQDPQLQRQTQRRALLQQINMADPTSLKQAIQASANDPELSTFLLGKYKELTAIQKDQSVIAKNEAWEAAKTDSEKKRNLLSEVEQALTEGKTVEPTKLNQARLAWAQETKPKTFQDPTTGTLQTVPGVDVNLFPQLAQTLTKTPTKAGTIETEKSTELKQQAVAKIDSSISGIDDSLSAIKGIRDVRAGSISTNPWLVDTLKKYPTAAADQDSLLRTVVANKVIGTIQEMKSQSATGATGFGALNGRELDQLEATVRALNPAAPSFEKQLKYVEDTLVKNKTALEKAKTQKELKLSSATGTGLNPQGNEGRIAILQQEYAKASQAGNQADMAGLTRELATLGAKPSTTGTIKGKLTFEQKVQQTMSDPKNAGKTRAQIEAALRAAGHN